MKIISDPIEVLNIGLVGGKPRPLRWKHKKGSEAGQIIKIDSIVDIRDENKAGIPTHIYVCESSVGDRKIRYEIKLTPSTSQWELYRY